MGHQRTLIVMELDGEGRSRRSPADGDSDADSEVGAHVSRALHLRWASIGLVAVGGTVGTAAREALSLAFPTQASTFPWTIFAINVVGAFALGLLIESLSRAGDDSGRRRRVRLLLGTGLLGGFTTYSAFAVDAALLLRAGEAAAGLGYAIATLLVGAVATWLGIAVGARAGSGARAER